MFLHCWSDAQHQDILPVAWHGSNWLVGNSYIEVRIRYIYRLCSFFYSFAFLFPLYGVGERSYLFIANVKSTPSVSGVPFCAYFADDTK